AGNLNCPADGRLVTGLEANYAARGDLRLHPCYPNPAAGQVCIPFSLQRAGRVTLTVFDALGRPVHQGQHAFGTPGLQRVYLDTGRYAGGVYTAVVRTSQSVLATQFAVHP
ncbi:MAG TPA: T9SS type A sorting domain-containing protein, partial [Cytophagales bacterium]